MRRNEMLGLIKRIKPGAVNVPEGVLSGSADAQLAFLRGLWEAEGVFDSKRMCPNVALILMDQHNVRSTVLVRRKALEQNPELLERLKVVAKELYNQAVIIGECPVVLEVDELPQWLKGMNPGLDDDLLDDAMADDAREETEAIMVEEEPDPED